ncbi:MAG: hypothetical protein PHU80_02435, partial [Kiritimatiellae bacterium]|nr:hypothetical protein [Kiritimatiellia bacterium]
MRKQQMRYIGVGVVFVLACRADVTVTNGGFELPAVAAGGYTTSAPDGWIWAGAVDKVGVAAQAQRFGGVAGEQLPAPAEGRQFAYMIGVGSLYQQVG